MTKNPDPVPFDRVSALVRLIAHDVRNGLNAIDLQSAYMAEVTQENEMREEIGKLRGMITNVTRSMQQLSSRVGEVRPTLLEYPARELAEALKETAEKQFEAQAKRIAWEFALEKEEIALDFNLLTEALLEVVKNAIHFREGNEPIRFLACAEAGSVVFEVSQERSDPGTDPSRWGLEPLVSGRRGGYGLGLFHARKILDALGGAWNARYDEATGRVVIRMMFPIATEKSSPAK